MQAEQQSERERFEADAGPYGFDLTRCKVSLSGEPWTEYRDSGTGHRWAGWLAAHEPHQLPQGATLSPPSTAQKPVAWATMNEEGEPAMLFFDKQEARHYCAEDDEPRALGYIAHPPPEQGGKG